jgi:hypothetical protein
MAKILINDMSFTGTNISSTNINGETIIIVDGKEVYNSSTMGNPSAPINITVTGDIEHLDVACCEVVKVQGNVKTLGTSSGNVSIIGEVSGNVNTASGNVSVENGSTGNVSTASGSVKVKGGDIKGNVKTISGDIKRN